MIEIGMNHIVKNFGFKKILDKACLEVMTGERAAIVGRNGTGKSTILKLISGEESPDSGEISIRRGATLGVLEQIPRLREPGKTVEEVLLEPFADVLAAERELRALEAEMASPVANRTIVLEAGQCVSYPGNYTFSMQEQERLMLQEFEQYKTQQKKIAAMKAAIKRFREWGAQADNPKFFRKAKELEKRLEKLEILERPQLEKPKVPIKFSGARTGAEVLRLRDFSLAFGETVLLEHAGLLVREKEKVCLMGDNGTGKTSLIKAVLGELADYSGEIVLNPSVQLGYIPQEIRFPVEKDSVLEAFRREHVCSEGEARNLLAKYFFLGANVFKRVSSLSGGEKVLLKLCILLQNQVNFLILDEPTRGIDVGAKYEIYTLMEQMARDGKTVIMISSEMPELMGMSDRIMVMCEGHLSGILEGSEATDEKIMMLASTYENANV